MPAFVIPPNRRKTRIGPKNPVDLLSRPADRRHTSQNPFATMTAVAALMILSRPALAGPAGGSVVQGSAAISQSGSVTNINQSTNKAIINWQGFSIGANETVNFNQPSSAAATLNRVIGNETSVISGALNANGQIFIVNSAGVLFGKGAQVNVGGLVASTLDITNENFMAGNYSFAGSSAASVVNQGRIHAGSGGYVALLGKTVSNDGVISAKLGTVAMASGDKITLNFDGNSLLDVTIDQGTLNALVANGGLVKADGGTVIMTAKAADAVLSAQVNNTGVIQARTIAALQGGSGTQVAKKGSIKLLADGGTVKVSGKLDASAPKGGDGGFIETSGDKVQIADSAVVTTTSADGQSGNWLIDPTDFTISAGAAAQTASGIGASTLLGNLKNGDITIVTASSGTANGDININAALDWSSTSPTPSAHSLTLAAANNIDVNAPITWSSGTLTLNAGANVYVNAVMTAPATGTANFVANYGHVVNSDGSVSSTVNNIGNGTVTFADGTAVGVNADGTPMGLYTYQGANNGAFAGKLNFSGTGSVTLNGASYTVINSLANLQTDISSDPANNYVLGSDLSVNSSIAGLGNFSGNFNGLGHLITFQSLGKLTGTGVFGTIGSGAVVSNFGISGATVSAGTSNADSVGILANSNLGNIINSFAGGSLTTRSSAGSTVTVTNAGGLVGDNSGLIAQSYSLANISVTDIGGGLVGTNEAGAKILDSSARFSTLSQQLTSTTVGTLGITYVGGLVGVNAGDIERSYAANRMSLADTASMAGGFVGENTGTISQSYATNGAFTTNPGNSFAKGPNLAGFVWDNSGTISDVYTSALYTTNPQSNWTAGFVGSNTGTISNAYTAEYSLGTASQYGFAKTNTGTITNAYWYANSLTATSTVTDATSGVTNLNAAQATSFASYAGFASSIWGASTSGYPILRNLPVYVNTTATSIPVYGGATSATSSLSLSVQGLQGGPGTQQDNVSSPNLFTVTTDGGYVDAGTQSAASILSSSVYKNIKGTVTVAPKALTIVGAVADKTYDGNNTATLSASASDGGLVGLVGNQTLAMNYTSELFIDKNAATGKTVNLQYTVADGANGGKASNYTIATTTTATITPKSISLSVTGNDKVYDGSKTDTVNVNWLLSGMIAGDTLSLNYTALFADANAGTGKTITVTPLSLGGTSSSNYTLGSTAPLSTNATINPLVLTLYGIKAPDGSDIVGAANLAIRNVVPGDQVSLSGSAKLASANQGTNAIVDVSGLTVNNPNYTLAGSSGNVAVTNASLALDQVASGTANIVSAGNTTTITTSDKAVIDWLRFSLSAGDILNFIQPAATSIVLNRVTGNEQSVINGALNANGRVFIVNSAGVIFTSTSQLNVGALVASTLNITDSNFAAGNYLFVGAGGAGSVVAAGDIVIADGGFAALVSGNGVSQSGILTAHGGKALLASADSLALTLNTGNNGLNSYGLGNLIAVTTAGGGVDVSATSGNGGLVETAGTSVVTTSGFISNLNTGTNGTWSWSQNNFSVGTGGTFSGQFVNDNLATRNLSLNAIGGGITVNDAVNWSANTTLTLAATNNININAPITASGATAGLVLDYGGYNGTTVTTPAPGTDYGINTANGASVSLAHSGLSLLNGAGLTINGHAYTLIHSMADLTPMNGSGSYFALAQNLDACGVVDAACGSATIYAGPVISTFNGTLAGLGHTIADLAINDAAGSGKDGLIGSLGSMANPVGTVRDLGLLNVNITGGSSMGAVAGYDAGNISNVYATGTVSATGTSDSVGGLVGFLYQGSITGSYAIVNVSGLTSVGGLVGNSSGGTITNSYAKGNVKAAGIVNPGTITSGQNIGGLVGVNNGGNITNSYATGDVTTTNSNDVGGLVGVNNAISLTSGNIANSYASGAVTSSGSYIGGLVGYNNGGIISGSHAGDGAVTDTGASTQYVGGLVGNNTVNGVLIGTIIDSYATGDVVAGSSSYVGGLVGVNYGVITASAPGLTYAKGNVTGDIDVGGLVGQNFRTISYANAYGNVTGVNFVGGFVGFNNSGTPGLPATIDHSNAFGDVNGVNDVGGFAGANGTTSNGTGAIGDASASGKVSGVKDVGGFAGYNEGVLRGVSASGDVSGTTNVGGLVGWENGVGSVINSFATGSVNGPNGGELLGNNTSTGTVTDSNYHDVKAEARAKAAAEAAAQKAAAEKAAAQAAAAQKAAIQQAAVQAANAIAANAATEATTSPNAATSTAGTQSAALAPKVDDNLKIEAPAPSAPAELERARRRAAAAIHKPAAPKGAGYGATIRSIDVDGQHFDLRDDSKKDAPSH